MCLFFGKVCELRKIILMKSSENINFVVESVKKLKSFDRGLEGTSVGKLKSDNSNKVQIHLDVFRLEYNLTKF